MASITLRQVEAFKAVVEHGTVSHAALALRVSQPSLSKLIVNLERDSRLALFERKKGRLILTAHGQRLYREIVRVFAGLDQINRIVTDIRNTEAQSLRIGVIPALSGKVLLETVRQYRDLYSQIRMTVLVRESHLLAEWIQNGQLDVLIASRSTDIQGLEQVPILHANAVCILPKGHPLADHAVITPALLQNEDMVALTDESSLPARVAAAFKVQGHTPRVVLETSLMFSVCKMVQAGMGVSIVHPLVAYSSGAHVHMRPFQPDIPVGFQIYSNKFMDGNAHVQAFTRLFQDVSDSMSDFIFSDGEFKEFL